jgi:exopolysaccharide production protein ExoQ
MAVRYVSGANVAEAGSRERAVLATLLVVIYIVYAAIGRDVFFNTLMLHTAPGDTTVNGFDNDPIGYYLPQARVLTCALAGLIVINNAGLTWAASKIPAMFAPFCLFAVASSLWAEDGHDAMRDSVVLLCLWLCLPMLIHRLGAAEMVKASLHLIAWVVILSFLVAVFLPEIGRHGAEEVGQLEHAGRWRGIFGHKNGRDCFGGPRVASRWSAWSCAAPRRGS